LAQIPPRRPASKNPHRKKKSFLPHGLNFFMGESGTETKALNSPMKKLNAGKIFYDAGFSTLDDYVILVCAQTANQANPPFVPPNPPHTHMDIEVCVWGVLFFSFFVKGCEMSWDVVFINGLYVEVVLIGDKWVFVDFVNV
jgi:hypothetical protein